MALLEFKGINKVFTNRRSLTEIQHLVALEKIHFSIEQGQTLGIVGESGSGKSTLAKLLMKLEQPSQGELLLEGRDIRKWSVKELSREVQMVFQNPLSSLNPRKTIRQVIEEPLIIEGQLKSADRRKIALDLMDRVFLRKEWESRYPHELSGGQRQRVAIARALALKPKILVCDEPVSALDVSVQAQVLNLLKELQAEYKWTMLFISHDLHVVRWLCSEVLVLYFGSIMEHGRTSEVFKNPQHPYTKALLQSVPSIHLDRVAQSGLRGEIPSPYSRPAGCVFQTRCVARLPVCTQPPPHLKSAHREWFCHLPPSNLPST